MLFRSILHAVREADVHDGPFRVSVDAQSAIHAVVEDLVIRRLERARQYAQHGGRVTLQARDLRLAHTYAPSPY